MSVRQQDTNLEPAHQGPWAESHEAIRPDDEEQKLGS